MIICEKCLAGYPGNEIGKVCKNPGCGAIIQEEIPFKDRIDVLPEPMRCPRRAENPMADSMFPDGDHWQKFKSNGDRVCSYCGSLHPDDFFKFVKESAEAPEDATHQNSVRIEQSDKRYKIYVHRSVVRNAMEGGIKFYTMHSPRNAEGKIEVSEQQEKEFLKAKQKSHERFMRTLVKR